MPEFPREYLLGSALFSKASLAGSTAGSKLRDAIAQPLQALCDRFQTSGVVCLVQSARLEHLYTAMPHRSAFILQPSAQSGPLYAMASGKLLLAHADAGFVRATSRGRRLAALTPKTLSTPDACGRNWTHPPPRRVARTGRARHGRQLHCRPIF